MTKRIIYLVVLMFSFVSCTKEIDLKLDEDAQKFVIEGIVTEGKSVHQIRITKNLNFNLDQPFPIVENALVELSDDQNQFQVLNYVGNGYYETTNFLAVQGREYTLKVTIEDEIFEAKSRIPSKVILDSLDVVEVFSVAGNTIASLVPKFQDIANVEGYYQFNVWRNDTIQKGIYLLDDKNSDGLINERPVFSDEFLPGYVYKVKMFCIDQPIYKYFFSLSQNSSSTPANPSSNFGKKCLGYFSARTESEYTITISN